MTVREVGGTALTNLNRVLLSLLPTMTALLVSLMVYLVVQTFEQKGNLALIAHRTGAVEAHMDRITEYLDTRVLALDRTVVTNEHRVAALEEYIREQRRSKRN